MRISTSFAALENPISRICVECGTSFFQPTIKLKRFCSKACGRKAYYQATYIRRGRRKGKFLPCVSCGIDVWRRPSALKKRKLVFCSKEHAIRWQKDNAFSFPCVICGKRVFTQPSQMRLRKRKTCSRECNSKMVTQLAELRRITNPPTEAALRRRIRYSKKMRKWRKAVFERDDYTCQNCGARNGNGKAIVLNADHIKSFALFPELRFDVDNGRTLCVDCHRKTDTHGRRPIYFEAQKLRNTQAKIG